ncbi:MAG: MBL fold metallo-hydrolase [Candidatus Binatia bacterium]|nr:MAG: MBL fold metallo-hydrolase [Candidatus Binatia bacterium]
MAMPEQVTQEVAPGVFFLTLPLPMKPSHVHVTLVRTEEGWVQLDSGMYTEESWALLQRVWRELGLGLGDLRALLVTHHHPDHFGASGLISEHTGASVFLHPAEALAAQHYLRREHSPEAVAFFRRHGIPLDRLGPVPPVGAFWAQFYRPARETTPLTDGQVFEFADRRVEVIATPGHTSGHCVFYLPRERLVIVGDHVLPKITPHIGRFPGGPENPLGDYLRSLQRIENLAVDLVLPAHGRAFPDLKRRIQQIIQHHEYRLREMLAAVHGQARTAYEVAALAWGFDEHAPLQIQFPATFEALAHLEYLRAEGKVVREDGYEVTRYRAV